MLQIVTRMYFRDVRLHETLHRAVFYTNGFALRPAEFELPIGRFLFGTNLSAVTPVTVEAVERLEAIRPNGEDEGLISTGGTELLNDAAAVYAFSLNVTCSRSATLVERLVPSALADRPANKPSNVLRGTFDPQVFLRDTRVEEARQFCTKLLALRRSHFEAAMRAIRKVIDATYLVGDDPSLAYTLFVSVLESLAQISTSAAEARSWDTYDSKKRKVIDSAIADLNAEDVAKVREAVLKVDQLSLARRFRAFTLDHVEPSFYRSEAIGAISPIRAHELPHALDVAYRYRSRNVHELRVLEPELWAISDRGDSLRSEGRSVLSLEGLNRLCRHVIRVFVDRSPTDLDHDFNYRDHLPGIVRVQLAPQYWIWKSEDFTARRAPAVLKGFIELLVPVLAGSDEPLPVDLSGVLEEIEKVLPGETNPVMRRPMVAVYILWHAFLDPQHHRARAAEVIEQYKLDLDAPTVVGFAVRVLTSGEIEWSNEELVKLVEGRRSELVRGRGQPLPPRLNTALFLYASERLWDNHMTEALSLISEAVESGPGDEGLIALELAARRGEKPTIKLLDFVLESNTWQPDKRVQTDWAGEGGEEGRTVHPPPTADTES